MWWNKILLHLRVNDSPLWIAHYFNSCFYLAQRWNPDYKSVILLVVFTIQSLLTNTKTFTMYIMQNISEVDVVLTGSPGTQSNVQTWSSCWRCKGGAWPLCWPRTWCWSRRRPGDRPGPAGGYPPAAPAWSPLRGSYAGSAPNQHSSSSAPSPFHVNNVYKSTGI